MPAKEQPRSDDKKTSTRQSPRPTAQSPGTLMEQTYPASIIQRARLDPTSLTPGEVLQLQRTVGNRAVGQLLEGALRHLPAAKPGAQAGGIIQRAITRGNAEEMAYFFGAMEDARKFLAWLGPQKAWNEIQRYLKASKIKNKPSLEEIAEYYGVAVEEPPAEEAEGEKEKMYTHPDGHESKHLKLSGNTVKALQKMTREGSPATFVGEWATNYPDKLKTVIEAAFPAEAQFVDCGEDVGVDAGETTTWVELYYGGEIGSHMRPKADSQVKGKTATL